MCAKVVESTNESSIVESGQNGQVCRDIAEYCIFGLYVQVRVINRDNPGVMQHSLTTLSSIALLRTDDLAHNV